jgi:D-alanyl-D-alanine carboxypeptidase (penicillin-binding protein 5/6)
MDPDTGELLACRDIHAIRAPASTTKMMTALLAVELGDPDELVTISHGAALEDGASLRLEEGERIPLGDLTHAMIVKSGNDGAVAIAEHFGGSVQGFAELMNSRAHELCMTDTHFVNPNGMPDDNHVSSAYDLALLAREFLSHPELKEWVSEQEVHFDRFGNREDVTFESTNYLLDIFPLANGIKTGYTNDAGYCLVASAAWRDKNLIAVVLGCERNTQWDQAIQLFDYGVSSYDPEYLTFRALYDNEVFF